jgi:hypothetical protein
MDNLPHVNSTMTLHLNLSIPQAYPGGAASVNQGWLKHRQWQWCVWITANKLVAAKYLFVAGRGMRLWIPAVGLIHLLPNLYSPTAESYSLYITARCPLLRPKFKTTWADFSHARHGRLHPNRGVAHAWGLKITILCWRGNCGIAKRVYPFAAKQNLAKHQLCAGF